MLKSIDVEPGHLARLKTLLRRHAPRAEVWAYGSRVSGGGHRSSDFDIVLRSPNCLEAPQENIAQVKEGLSESDIPFLVDVLDWARIPDSFRLEISKEYVVIQNPEGD
jgi:predicted nucleotidyltransferase